MKVVIENVLSSTTVLLLAGIWRTGVQKLRSIENRLKAVEKAIQINGQNRA